MFEPDPGEQVIPADVKNARASSSLSHRAAPTIGLGMQATKGLGHFFDIAIHPQGRLLIWFLKAGRRPIHEIKHSLGFYTMLVLPRTAAIPDSVP